MSNPAQGPEDDWDRMFRSSFREEGDSPSTATNGEQPAAPTDGTSGVRTSPMGTPDMPSFVDTADDAAAHGTVTKQMPVAVFAQVVAANEPPPGTKTGETLPPPRGRSHTSGGRSSTAPAGEPCHDGDHPPRAAGIPGTPPTAEHRDTLEGMGNVPRPRSPHRSTRRVFALSLVLLLVSLLIGGVAAGANYVINNWWLINPF